MSEKDQKKLPKPPKGRSSIVDKTHETDQGGAARPNSRRGRQEARERAKERKRKPKKEKGRPGYKTRRTP